MSFSDSFENIEFSPYKWVTHINELTTLAEGGDIFPITVELDLVAYCNHHCGWCVDPLHMQNTLERSFVSELLNELKSLGVEGIVFKGGGEPTLYKPFPDVIEEARKFGFEIGIVTNGSRLLKLYHEIVQNSGYLRVSIDGPTPESHQKIHGSNDFESIIEGTYKAVELRNNLCQRHPIIGFSFAMDYSLIGLVDKAINLGDSLGVDYILLRPPFFEEVGRKNTMTIQQKKGLFSAYERESKSYQGKMKVFIDYWISDSEASKFSSRCESPRRGRFMQQAANGIEHITKMCLASPLLAVITADKKVYPCCNLRFLKEWNVGTIDYKKGNTFKKLWKSDIRKKVIERIHNVECIKFCTHPMSRYNEVIEYLKTSQHHKGFV